MTGFLIGVLIFIRVLTAAGFICGLDFGTDLISGLFPFGSLPSDFEAGFSGCCCIVESAACRNIV
jgi:hypothetical protein